MDRGETDQDRASVGESPLAAAHEAYQQGDWPTAFEQFTIADSQQSLSAGHLWDFSVACAMIDRDDDYFQVLERAFDAYLNGGEPTSAIRCAFWLGMRSLMVGEVSRGTGWLARAQRLLAREASESVEHGYLRLSNAERQLAAGEYEDAFSTAANAVALAERFDDQDLLSLALHVQGRARIKQARVPEGLELFDEAMLTASTGKMFPPLTGVVYCGVISACRSVFEMGRAKEWTATLSEWCERQRGNVAFVGQCLVHRSEIFRFHGDWHASLSEARRACAPLTPATHPGTGLAHYQEGEVLRLMGDFAGAEQAYRKALECGKEPQPGLALLRLLQGKSEAARASLARTLGETTDPLKRARLLPAFIECLLETGSEEEAREFCEELTEIAENYGSPLLGAAAAQSRGELELSSGNHEAAIRSLRLAWRGWQEFEAPYEIARVRVSLGKACRELGDEDSAKLEFEAAGKTFAELGARPDLERTEALLRPTVSEDSFGLSPREREVLRFIAAGESNKAIAARLQLSERTVHRHVSNIFMKLEVSSRSAATSFAYQHGLVG